MKLKSKLGIAALEELNDEVIPETGEGGETGATDESAAAAATAAVPETGAAEGGAEAGAAGAEAGAAGSEEGGAAAGGAESGEAGGEAEAAAAAADAPEGAAGEGGAEGAPEGAAAAAGGEAGEGSEEAAAAQTAAAAMSEAESTGDPVEVMADIGEAEAEEVEGEMEAVDQIEGDTADVQEDVAKLAGATESLEGCVAILDAAAQRGGLDVFASSFLRNNVGTVTRSLKLKPLLLPALEDMETPSAKIAGANNAKDQIVAFINRIIDTIKQGFDRLSTWIIETYKRLTNAFVAIERRAEKLKERISAATMKEGELDNAKLAGAMLVYGEASTGLDVATTVKDMGELAKFMNDPKSYKDYLTALDLCEELVKSPEKEDEIRGKISQTLKSFSSGFSNHAVNISRALVKTADKTEDGSTSTFALGLFGNQEVRITLPTSADGIRSLRATVQAANEVSGANKKVTAADQKAALKICEQVAATAKVAREAAEANKGGVKELIEEIKKRKDIVMGQAKVAADAEDGAADRLRKVMAYVSGFFASTPGLPVHGINRALPRNLGIALDYVAASIAGAAPAEGAAA